MVKVKISSLFFYFLYFPKFIQYFLRLSLIFRLKKTIFIIYLFLSLIFGFFSFFFSDADFKYIISDLFIDFSLLYWLHNISFRHKIIPSFIGAHLAFLYLLFLFYTYFIGGSLFIEDWRGFRLLSFYNGAAGIVLMSFSLNFFLWKKDYFTSIVLFILLYFSQSRMALLAPFVSYGLSKIMIYYPRFSKFFIIVVIIFCFSSFIWLPLTGINGTGRFLVWSEVFLERNSVFWYGEIFKLISEVSPTEDQLHSLYLHLFVSRHWSYLFLFMAILLLKFFKLIDYKNDYGFSLLLLFILHSCTDNVVLYSFLIPFIF
jgi:hypothetical protein